MPKFRIRSVLLLIVVATSPIILGLKTSMAEDSDVEIRKVDGRSEATIKSNHSEAAPERGQKHQMAKTFTNIEKSTSGVASASSNLLGRGTDGTVETVQKVGGSSLARFFRFLDFSRKKEQTKS